MFTEQNYLNKIIMKCSLMTGQKNKELYNKIRGGRDAPLSGSWSREIPGSF